MKNEVKLQDGLCIEFNEFIQNLSFAKSKSNNNIYLRLEKETSGITEEQFSQMFHQSIAGIVIVSENFKFLKVNHIFCNLVGYNAEELLENSFLEIIHPADKKIIKEYSIRALSGEFDTFQFEIRFIHKNGSEIWCLVNSSLIGDIYNYPVHFIIQIIDISTQKNAINNLIQSEQKFKKFFYTLPDMA